MTTAKSRGQGVRQRLEQRLIPVEIKKMAEACTRSPKLRGDFDGPGSGPEQGGLSRGRLGQSSGLTLKNQVLSVGRQGPKLKPQAGELVDE